MSAELDFSAGLHASIATLSEQLQAEQRQRRDMWASVAYVRLPAFGFAATAGQFNTGIPSADNGMPKPGYAWAVQRITIGGLGITTSDAVDTCQVYRGTSAADIQSQNYLNLLNHSSPTWHPGRTGLILQYGEMLLFDAYIQSGNSDTTVVASVDAIQVRADKLPYFLV